MTSVQPPPTVQIDLKQFIDHYNSDLLNITEDMLDFVKQNGVDEEWLIATMQDLFFCNSAS